MRTHLEIQSAWQQIVAMTAGLVTCAVVAFGLAGCGGSAIKHIITTDTVPIPPEKMKLLDGRITVLSIAPMLGEVIRRAHEGRSVGEMFNE